MGIEVFENYECEGQISLDNIEESENASASKKASQEQLDIFDILGSKPKVLDLQSEIKQDEITDEVSKIFDYEFDGIVHENIEIPIFPKDFEIGLIVGSSGSGKSTILHESFGYEEKIEWDMSKSVASHFGSFEEASNKFGAVGLNSIPKQMELFKE